MSLTTSKLLIGPFRQLLTLEGLPAKGAIRDEDMPVLPDAGILLEDGRVSQTGSFAKLALQAGKDIRVQELTDDFVGMPAFIDSHTHICFAGSRAMDYQARLAGKSYLDIARAGGGIQFSVARTREASLEELAAGIVSRAQQLSDGGVATIEVKSGYGLNVEDELKMLRAIRLAQAQTAVRLVPTCLAAHLPGPEYKGRSQEYLDYILAELLPIVKAEKLSHRVDIFVEETAFAVSEARSYLRKAQEMGFDLTVHADQFSPGGSALAVELGARSADHLEATDEAGLAALAGSETVATVLPGASLGLGLPFAPARRLLDAGACVAIASDWNPGSAPMGDLLTQAALLSVYEKLSAAETFAGMTYRAGQALGLPEGTGRIRKGEIAEMILFPTDDYREILYHQGQLRPALMLSGDSD